MNAIACAELLSALDGGGYTLAELAEESGLHIKTVGAYCNALHKAGLIHIQSWANDRAGRSFLKVYQLGSAKDAKNRLVTNSESMKRWRAKQQMQALSMAVGALPMMEAA